MTTDEARAGFARRQFLRGAGAFAVLPLGGGFQDPPGERASSRIARAYDLRVAAARAHRERPLSVHRSNGDEERYADRAGSFTKGLPHNYRGEVNLTAYGALQRALDTGKAIDFERVPLGKVARLVNPQAAFAYVLEGPDPQQSRLDPPPPFDSERIASEMVELYWHAVTRDVLFADYAVDSLTVAAAEELTRCTAFAGPRLSGRVTADTLFRGGTAGDLTGPYVSQFLWKDVPYGATTVPQRYRVPVPRVDYLFTFDRWLSIQNGDVGGRLSFQETPRYIRTARDLAEYVHRDFTYQAFLAAALILLGPAGAAKSNRMDHSDPYYESRTQAGFATFGEPHVLDLVARVAGSALRACWFQKWLVHRRLRPEEFGGKIHLHQKGEREYPLHDCLLHASVLERVLARSGTCLLTQAYPEGAPLHPAYPSGHATVAGACTTALKAIFDETLPMPDPVMPGPDGVSLEGYQGPSLTVGGELDKLACNVAFGRNAAGLHWRSDAIDGLALGEEVAIGILADMKRCLHEEATLSLARFDGTRVAI